MSNRDRTRQYTTTARMATSAEDRPLEFIAEEPILIRIEDEPYAVVMRTPGEEKAHAAGFCLGEGIAATPSDIRQIGYDEAAEPNIVDVWVDPARRIKILDRLERRFFVSQTSCGICGKELIKDLHQILTPTRDPFTITLTDAFACFDRLSESQQHYQTTRGSHAALLFDESLDVIAFAEDVGRHNALDKAIGKAFLAGTAPSARVAVLSSRISYELVQKAARTHIPVLISGSRPTSLAVEIGRALNMALVFPQSEEEMVVVCGGGRIGEV